MIDERLGKIAGAWLRSIDHPPADPQRSVRRLMEQVRETPQVKRTWRPGFLARERIPIDSHFTTELPPTLGTATDGRRPAPVPSRLEGRLTMSAAAKVAMAGLGFALVGGLFLSAALTSPPQPPGAASSPSPAPPAIQWTTEVVDLAAESFSVETNDLVFTYEGGTPLDIGSDPGGPDYVTLEIIWSEHDREQRLNMYFGSDGTDWWVDEIRTYDGYEQGEWIYAYGPFFRTPLGEIHEGDVHIDLLGSGRPGDPGNLVSGVLTIEGMRLEATPRTLEDLAATPPGGGMRWSRLCGPCTMA